MLKQQQNVKAYS